MLHTYAAAAAHVELAIEKVNAIKMKNDPRDYVELKKSSLTYSCCVVGGRRGKCQLLSKENYYGNLRNVRKIIEIFTCIKLRYSSFYFYTK